MKKVLVLAGIIVGIMGGVLLGTRLVGTVHATSLRDALAAAQAIPYGAMSYPDALQRLRSANVPLVMPDVPTYPKLQTPQGSFDVQFVSQANNVNSLCYSSDRDSTETVTVGDVLGIWGDPDQISLGRPDYNGTMLITLLYPSRNASALAIVRGTWREVGTEDEPAELYRMALDSPLLNVCFANNDLMVGSDAIPYRGFFYRDYPDFSRQTYDGP